MSCCVPVYTLFMSLCPSIPPVYVTLSQYTPCLCHCVPVYTLFMSLCPSILPVYVTVSQYTPCLCHCVPVYSLFMSLCTSILPVPHFINNTHRAEIDLFSLITLWICPCVPLFALFMFFRYSPCFWSSTIRPVYDLPQFALFMFFHHSPCLCSSTIRPVYVLPLFALFMFFHYSPVYVLVSYYIYNLYNVFVPWSPVFYNLCNPCASSSLPVLFPGPGKNL